MPPLARNMIDIQGAGDRLAQWTMSRSLASIPIPAPTGHALTSPAAGAVFNQSDTLSLSATA